MDAIKRQNIQNAGFQTLEPAFFLYFYKKKEVSSSFFLTFNKMYDILPPVINWQKGKKTVKKYEKKTFFNLTKRTFQYRFTGNASRKKNNVLKII